jgi:hypothetical protein
VAFPQRLAEAEAALFLFGSNGDPRTLQYWRAVGKGPAYHKLGARVVYDLSDLQAFLEAGRVQPRRSA